MSEQLGRRRFLKLAGIGAGSLGAAAALSQPGKIFSAGTSSDASIGSNVEQTGTTADDMDAVHPLPVADGTVVKMETKFLLLRNISLRWHGASCAPQPESTPPSRYISVPQA